MRWGWMGGVVVVAAGVVGCRATSLEGGGAAANDGGAGGVPSSVDGGAGMGAGGGGAGARGTGGDGGGDGVEPPPGGRILPVLNHDVHDTCATRTPAGWCWVSPRPQGSWLFDVSSPRTAELWAVGYGGTVLHGTAPSGAPAAWELVDAGLTAELTAVSATADGAVWIGTHDGDVVRGDGAAGGWTTLPRPGLSQVSGLWAAGRDEAWAVGANSAVVYHWTDAGDWTPFDLGLDGVAAVTGRARDDVWMATGIGHSAHWDGAGWQSGDIAIQFRSQYTPTVKEDLVFTRMGVLDDGTVWASAASQVDNFVGYFLAGGAWSLSEAYTMAGASMADHWASGARGSVMHVSPFGPDAANVIQVGGRPLLAGHANDGWVIASNTTARHAGFGQWEAEPFLFTETYYVAASRPDDVWISGLNERYHGELAHWDGRDWSMFALGDDVRNPVPIALGTSGAWFAGTSLWHWDGQAVAEIPYPASLVPAGDWFATNVVATPTGNVWVVLGQGIPGPKFMLRFDGRRWHTAPLPAWVPYGYESGFRGTSDRDLWLIGNSTLAHFDGERWSDPVVLPSSAGFEDIVPLAPNDVWAGPFHFDGARWANTLTPPVDSLGMIYGSWAESTDDVWMTTSTGLRHWDGRSWSGPLAVPSFYSWVWVSGTGPGDVWISGAGGVIHGVTTRAAP